MSARLRLGALRTTLLYGALLMSLLFLAFLIPNEQIISYGVGLVPSASDFIITGIPVRQFIQQGSRAAYTINVTSVGNFSSPVSLQVSGVPSGSTGNLSPAAITPPAGGSATSSFILSTDWSTPVGGYNLTIVGTSALPQITHSITVTLDVTPDGDFVIDANPRAPTPLVIHTGQCGNYKITVMPIGNFTAPVGVTLVNATGQVNWQVLSNGTVGLGGGIESFYVLRVCVKDWSMPGNYTLTVLGRQARGLEITHTAVVLLTIPTPSCVIPLVALVLGLVIVLLALSMSRRRNPKTS